MITYPVRSIGRVIELEVVFCLECVVLEIVDDVGFALLLLRLRRRLLFWVLDVVLTAVTSLEFVYMSWCLNI